MNLKFDLQLFTAFTGLVQEGTNLHVNDNGGGLEVTTDFGAGIGTAVSGLAVGDIINGWVGFPNTGVTVNPNTGLSTPNNVNLGGIRDLNIEFVINGVDSGNGELMLAASGISVTARTANNVRLTLNSSSLSWINFNNVRDKDITIYSAYNNFLTASSVDINGGTRNINFANSSTISLRADDGNQGIRGQLNFANDDTKASLLKGSNLTSTTITGTKSGVLTFNTRNSGGDILNFGPESNSVRADVIGVAGGANVQMSFQQVEQATLNLRGSVSVTKQDGTVALEASTLNINTKANTTLDFAVGDGDSLSHVSITSGSGTATVALTGRGIETINAGASSGNFALTNFNFATGGTTTGEINDNVINIGDKSLLTVDGRKSGNTAMSIAAGGTNIVINSAIAANGAEDRNIQSWESFRTFDNTNGLQTVLYTDGTALDNNDKNLAFKNYALIVGTQLNLGDRTDKSVVDLGNRLGWNVWPEINGGDSNAYGISMESVISSSVGNSLLLGNVDRAIWFHANGANDSLYAGATSANSNFSSAEGKRAYFGTSAQSGATTVTMSEDGVNTTNFGLANVEANEANADVVALMGGAAYMTVTSSEFGRTDFTIGSVARNSITFDGLEEKVHDILYTYDLGATTFKARVDTSLSGAVMNYDDSVDFYVGFNNGTKLTFASGDSNKKLNYQGGAVLTGISTIDGSAAGAGNIINGASESVWHTNANEYAEYIVGSSTGATTLCGGVANDSYWTDNASDTLVGGAVADEFWVGANMGNDVLQNIGKDDVIVFKKSKYEDATITHDMIAAGDASNYVVSFKDGATITLNASSKLSTISALTMEFDDGTYAWNGTEWNFTQK